MAGTEEKRELTAFFRALNQVSEIDSRDFEMGLLMGLLPIFDVMVGF